MPLSPPLRHVGILGGGQLARFLCAAARRLGIRTTVLTPLRNAPASATADHLVHATLDDLGAIQRLANAVDVVTVEREDIPTETLALLGELAAAGACAVHPEPRVVRLVQDKLQQKRWLVAEGLPTAPFRPCSATEDPAMVATWFGLPCVQKARRGGFDGRGVQVLRDVAGLWPVPSLVEPFLTGARELAVLAARGGDGSVATFAPVDLLMDPRSNALDTVLAPSTLPASVRAEARLTATRLLRQLGGVGVFAVEFFLTPAGELLVNEVSPRVHNAGHHTLDSSRTCQFEQHLRAITGRRLGDPALLSPAAMRNLLFDPDDPTTARPPAPAQGVAHYWYDKAADRPWRKLGHCTALAERAGQAAGRITGSGLEAAG